MRRRLASVAFLAATCGLYLASLPPGAGQSITTEVDLPGLHVGPDQPLQVLRIPIELKLPVDADPDTVWVEAGISFEVFQGREDLGLHIGACGDAPNSSWLTADSDYATSDLPLTVCRDLTCSTSLCLAAQSTGDGDVLLDADPRLTVRFDGPLDMDRDTSEAWIEAGHWTLDTSWPFEGEAP